MKKNNVLCLCVVLMLAVGANAQTVSDTQNSGCLSHTRGAEDEQVPTIVLKKEGNILSVEVQNFISNCATSDFVVNSSIDEGGDCDPWTLTINVIPVLGELLADCVCPFNVTSTIRDIERNHFYLDCWWYQGYVELKDGEPLVLEDVREDVTIGGVNYSLRKALHHAMLKKSEWERELHIPFEVNYEGQTYSVISIDKDAFRDNTTLTKVTIPHTIKNLGFDAAYGFYMNPFIGCTALESIEVDEVNPVVCSIEGVLFNKEKTKLLCFPAAANCTSYTVPEGVNWIEGCAFMNNRNLVNVTLPDGVATLGSSAFYGCESLEEVKLSNSLQGLGSWTFGNCRHLKSVTIPEGVTFLGTSLFSGCTNLTSVTMPESITSIDYAVFENCTSLKSITLSPNLDQIEQKLFLNCNSLTEIQIPKGVTWVRSNAFQGCTSLKTVDLPESVYGLGDFLFSGCQLESLYIRGVIDFSFSNHYYLFDGMGTQTNVYVLPTEVEKFKTIYNGPIYPLSEQANGIFDISNPSINTSDFFDLQGRRLKYPSAKGVYIQNGRKQIKH